ncbi:MAG TPA: enoyl-CoA hydratase/isomerase family protein [Vineibacter sp.]|nr:enoyl-CoA hydratase/isomerase family protein [Vineibacter sp.]
MARSPIVRKDRGAVAVLTLNRPAKRNAITTAMMWTLGDHIRRLQREPRVRAILLTGAGPHFSAGGDMQEMLGMDTLATDDKMVAWQENLEVIERSLKPVIAAVHGAAFGGGTELAMACHIRICADDARFAQTEIALDHLPGGGGTQRLPRLIPLGLAYEHLLLGTPIDAATALRIGLVNHVSPRDRLMDDALDLAGRIAARGPVAIRYTMEAVRSGLMAPLEVGMRLERAFAALVNESAEARAGMRQFFGAGRRPTTTTAQRTTERKSRRRS